MSVHRLHKANSYCTLNMKPSGYLLIRFPFTIRKQIDYIISFNLNSIQICVCFLLSQYCFNCNSIYCCCQSLYYNNRRAVNIAIIFKEMHCLPASPTRKPSIRLYAIGDKIVVGAMVCTTYMYA